MILNPLHFPEIFCVLVFNCLLLNICFQQNKKLASGPMFLSLHCGLVRSIIFLVHMNTEVSRFNLIQNIVSVSALVVK